MLVTAQYDIIIFWIFWSYIHLLLDLQFAVGEKISPDKIHTYWFLNVFIIIQKKLTFFSRNQLKYNTNVYSKCPDLFIPHETNQELHLYSSQCLW